MGLAVLALVALLSLKLSGAAARSGLPWSHGPLRSVSGAGSSFAHAAVTVGQISWAVFWGALVLAAVLVVFQVGGENDSQREGGRTMLNTKVVAWSLAIWGGVSFILCVLYGLIVPGASGPHQSLEPLLPGFKWLTWLGFLVGLAWSLAYGLYAGWLFAVIYNWASRRWGATQQ